MLVWTDTITSTSRSCIPRGNKPICGWYAHHVRQFQSTFCRVPHTMSSSSSRHSTRTRQNWWSFSLAANKLTTIR
ncbi:uncharacterized protein BCR38DRAFT_442613 [Pseudomassariella vexata]|uniref:Uncharacterized protein n=1 Tax=Pseudomassariella vexata TaxID=1141098 RepID=A0A1Y2DNS7_9PEZI|nr:uncharacterized protein BCR38DRAFT_442613 [Pseudomassariella vexata]ORY60819.1 hypothetical protein BCR38DRAFT_442613 [Pseudomassariella vexata]